MLKSPLKNRALEVLLIDCIGVGKITRTQVRLVLEALPRLKSWYVKPEYLKK
jgi:hypothetical protein